MYRATNSIRERSRIREKPVCAMGFSGSAFRCDFHLHANIWVPNRRRHLEFLSSTWALARMGFKGDSGTDVATSERWRALRQSLLNLMNFAVLTSRSGKEPRRALSQKRNSSSAHRVARISGCDCRFTSATRIVFKVGDDSMSHGGFAGSIVCVFVSGAQGASV